jgi:hypothetical protein
VLKCLFPYSQNPGKPGEKPHYCLVVDVMNVYGKAHAVVCYGTSKLSSEFSTISISLPSSSLIGDQPPGAVTHFVLSHTAYIPLDDEYVYGNFASRIDPSSTAGKHLIHAEALFDQIAVSTVHRVEATPTTGPFDL